MAHVDRAMLILVVHGRPSGHIFTILAPPSPYFLSIPLDN
jgi:hypothetical protein